MTPGDRKTAEATVLASLASGSTVLEAARAAGISEATAYRKLREPAFCQALGAARADLIKRATGRLAAACSSAVATLVRLLQADAESVQLGAARSIMELAVKMRESEELEGRIAALEERAELRKRQEPSKGGRSWVA